MAYYTEYEPEGRRRFAGGWVGWGLVAALIIGGTAASTIPSDQAIEWPGPVYDTLGTVETDGVSVALIDIPSQQTYPTTGSLSMLTVTTLGDRKNPASWLHVFQAWLDPSQEAVPLDLAFPDGQTPEQSEDLGAAQMKASQQSAVAAALSTTGYEYTTSVSVVAAAADGPSHELLLAGDVITAVNVTAVTDSRSLRALIAESGVDQPLTLTVTREGTAIDVVVTPVLNDAEVAEPVVGIEVFETFTFPFEVNVQLSEVGGPSAGQMFALAIVDKLTPGSLTGNRAVAGTGTITHTGEIGPIGGITQKLYGAERAGAKVFLAPAGNCKDLQAGSVPEGLDVYAVATLADSISVLNTLATGAGTSLLPRCPAS